MRSVITKEAAYVFNPWSNGKRHFGRLGGSTFSAMKQAAQKDIAMAARIEHLTLRSVEEYFDLTSDSGCLNNLVGRDSRKVRVDALRSKLRAWMVEVKDPTLDAFDKRGQPAALEIFVQNYRAAAQKGKDELRVYEKKKGYRF